MERDPLAMAMLAAWMNVRVDQVPPENTSHLNPATMAAWRRVAEAAFAYRDSDASLAEDPKGLSREAVAARAEGIARKEPSHD